MSNNSGRPSSPHLISFEDGDEDGFEDNFGKDVAVITIYQYDITPLFA